MIEVEGVLLSEDLLKEEFVCNLNACKGACCIEGDSGAPLEQHELQILKDIYPEVKPYMTAKGIAAIELEGTHVIDEDGDFWCDICELIFPHECVDEDQDLFCDF